MIERNRAFLQQVNAVADGLLVAGSFFLAFWIRFHLFAGGNNAISNHQYVTIALLLVPLHLFIYMLLGLYETQFGQHNFDRSRKLVWGNVIALVILGMGLFIFKEVHVSRLGLLLFFCLENLLLLTKNRLIFKRMEQLRASGRLQRQILAVGSSENLQNFRNRLLADSGLGLRLLGYVSDREVPGISDRLGDISQLDRLLEELNPEEVVACLGADEYDRLPQVISACEKAGIKLTMIPAYAQYMPGQLQVDMLGDIPLIKLRRFPLDHLGNAFLKRTVDVVGSLVCLILASPIMLITAIGIKLTSPGPVIFSQQRVGRNNRTFQMYKFRSMRVNTGSDTTWTKDRDDRRTAFGSLIRKCSIDELPQLFNVLKGDMSLVGPRPELPKFVKEFQDTVPSYMVKHQVRPGITGWAQVHGLRGDTSIPERIRHDLYYIENWSLALDVRILLMTPGKLINREKLK